MIRVLLDTDAVIDLAHSARREFDLDAQPTERFLSVVTLGEIEALRYDRGAALDWRRLSERLREVETIPIDARVTEYFGRVISELRERQTLMERWQSPGVRFREAASSTVRDNRLWVAASALAYRLTPVSSDPAWETLRPIVEHIQGESAESQSRTVVRQRY